MSRKSAKFSLEGNVDERPPQREFSNTKIIHHSHIAIIKDVSQFFIHFCFPLVIFVGSSADHGNFSWARQWEPIIEHQSMATTRTETPNSSSQFNS